MDSVKAKFALHLDTRETRNYAGRLGRMEFRKRLSTSILICVCGLYMRGWEQFKSSRASGNILW